MKSIISRVSLVASLSLIAGAVHAAILPGDLLISEVLANPGAVSDTAGEWFELYNASANAIDLNGVKIRDEGSNAFTISGALLINPGQYLVLGRSNNPATNGGVFSYQLTPTAVKFGLGDSGTPGAAGSSTLPLAAAPVPVPAAAWLFGSATTGLIGLRRKKK